MFHVSSIIPPCFRVRHSCTAKFMQENAELDRQMGCVESAAGSKALHGAEGACCSVGREYRPILQEERVNCGKSAKNNKEQNNLQFVIFNGTLSIEYTQ